MRNTLITTAIILTVILSFTGIVQGEEFNVSCIIPAIPGINAPLIQENTVTAPPTAQGTSLAQESTQDNSNALIQEEEPSGEIVLAQNSVPIMIETLYSR